MSYEYRVSKAPEHKVPEGKSVTGDSLATWEKTSGLLPPVAWKKTTGDGVREAGEQTQKPAALSG